MQVEFTDFSPQRRCYLYMWTHWDRVRAQGNSGSRFVKNLAVGRMVKRFVQMFVSCGCHARIK